MLNFFSFFKKFFFLISYTGLYKNRWYDIFLSKSSGLGWSIANSYERRRKIRITTTTPTIICIRVKTHR